MSVEEEEPTQLHQEEKPLEELVKEQQEALRLQDECIRLQQERIGLQDEYIHLQGERIDMYEKECALLRHLSSDLSIRVQQLENHMNKDSHNSYQTFSGHYLYQQTKGVRKKSKKKSGRS